MYITYAIAELATNQNSEPDVIVTSVCPGACKSDLPLNFKNAGLGYSIGLKLFDILFTKPTEEGARAYVSAASLGPEGHGGWWKTTAPTT